MESSLELGPLISAQIVLAQWPPCNTYKGEWEMSLFPLNIWEKRGYHNKKIYFCQPSPQFKINYIVQTSRYNIGKVNTTYL